MPNAVADAIVILAELRVQPERRDAFLDYAVANLPICRGYPGNRQFDILLDPATPEVVRFYEVWETVAAQQAYMAWRTAAGDFVTLMSFLAATPSFVALRAVTI